MAVIVNGETVDQAEFDQEYERLKPHYEEYVEANDPDASDEQLHDWVRETVIERTLVMQEARNRNEDIPTEEIDEAFEGVKDNIGETPEDEVRADIRLQMRIDRLMKENVAEAAEPTEDEMKAVYEESKDDFLMPEQVRASHIVKHVDSTEGQEEALKEITEIKEQLDAGVPFEELAMEHSDCPDSAGDLGLFARGQMVQEFEDVVFDMQVGQISDVFITCFGYHIAKVTERKEPTHASFEDVREHIAEQMTSSRGSSAVEEYIDTLKEKATIEVTDD